MRLSNIREVDGFLETVNSCRGAVWLEDGNGSKLNLKSRLSQYIAVSALITSEGDSLQLFCSLPEDEPRFYGFFRENPGVV